MSHSIPNRHPNKALNPAKLASLKEPGRYTDGGGLYLVVDRSGAKRWLLRIVVKGRRRDIGLGGLATTSLATARELAVQYRSVARSGGDPLAERRKARRVVPTFEQAARDVHEDHKRTWRNEKHRAQWLNTLATYVFPRLGTRAVDEIETQDVLAVLRPIWLTKPETARRIKQRIATVLDWAKAAGNRDGENPVLGVAKGLPKQPERKNHHGALAYAEVPAFLQNLRDCTNADSVKLALELAILTAARTGEILHAKWSEFDLKAGVWVVPAERMKTGEEHRVPLAPQAVAILNKAKGLGSDDWVFPGRRINESLSQMALLMALRRTGVKATVHGFRSSFRDWASEQTNFANEVCEMALAHAVESKVEAAYRRTDLFEKRRELMAEWANYATGLLVSNLAEPRMIAATRGNGGGRERS